MSKRDLVAGLVFDGEENVLLEANIKHNSFRITPIGGKREDGELPEEALAREFREEYGLIVLPVERIGPYPTRSKGEGDFDVHTYLCRIVDASESLWEDGKPTPFEPDKSAFADWFSLADLNALHARNLLAPNLALLIETLQANYQYFELGDLHRPIPGSISLFQLIFWMKTMLHLQCRDYEDYLRRHGRDMFTFPPEFLAANETPQLAREYFAMCAALDGNDGKTDS